MNLYPWCEGIKGTDLATKHCFAALIRIMYSVVAPLTRLSDVHVGASLQLMLLLQDRMSDTPLPRIEVENLEIKNESFAILPDSISSCTSWLLHKRKAAYARCLVLEMKLNLPRGRMPSCCKGLRRLKKSMLLVLFVCKFCTLHVM